MPDRIALTLVLVVFLVAPGCGDDPARESGAPGEPAATLRTPAQFEGTHDVAVVTVEGMGVIRIELLPEIAPQTVADFSKLAEGGSYDGTTFHRVIPGFMIQGGDPTTRKPDPRRHGRGGHMIFPDEFAEVTHTRGAVSLANKGSRGTANGQFFIVHQDSPQLDQIYTLFGRVSDGIEVLDAITALEIDQYGRYGPRDRPYPDDARITSIRIERAAPAQ